MARPRQPIDLVIAKGRKHLTESEVKKRRSEEFYFDGKYRDVQAPEYLTDNLRSEFDEIAAKLVALGVMTELDEDTLARYLLAKQQYLKFTLMLNRAIQDGKLHDVERMLRMQDKSFQQCRAGANDLGLTIKSRASLVVPKTDTEPKGNKFARFETG